MSIVYMYRMCILVQYILPPPMIIDQASKYHCNKTNKNGFFVLLLSSSYSQMNISMQHWYYSSVFL